MSSEQPRATEMDLSGSDIKIERAKKHLAELREEVTSRFHPGSYAVTREVAEDGLAYTYSVTGAPQVPPEWAAIVGDVLTNLRASLDHLAYRLVELDSGSPGDRTYFPIVETRFNRGGTLRIFDKLGHTLSRPDLTEAVEHSQPYTRSSADGGPSAHHLSDLDRLVQIDKHRLLLGSAAVLDPEMWWGLPAGVTCTPSFNFSQLRDGTPVARFTFSGPPGEHFDPNISVAVVLQDGRRVAPVVEYLDGLIGWVDVCIFEMIFRPISRGDAPALV